MYLPERYQAKGGTWMHDRFRKLSHTIYECKYHIVMCPKYGYRIFKDDVAEYTKQQLDTV